VVNGIRDYPVQQIYHALTEETVTHRYDGPEISRGSHYRPAGEGVGRPPCRGYPGVSPGFDLFLPLLEEREIGDEVTI
jgi:hypothetical protein